MSDPRCGLNYCVPNANKHAAPHHEMLNGQQLTGAAAPDYLSGRAVLGIKAPVTLIQGALSSVRDESSVPRKPMRQFDDEIAGVEVGAGRCSRECDESKSDWGAAAPEDVIGASAANPPTFEAAPAPRVVTPDAAAIESASTRALSTGAARSNAESHRAGRGARECHHGRQEGRSDRLPAKQTRRTRRRAVRRLREGARCARRAR